MNIQRTALSFAIATIAAFSGTAVFSAEDALTDADQWVLHRTEPWAMQAAAQSKKSTHPVRKFVKGVGKELKKEAGDTFLDMAKDSAFVFSVQNIDPFDQESPPLKEPAVVMEANLIDGSTCYLHRFPDNSFAVEGGFADNTVIVPTQQHQFVVKYPNGAIGKFVRSNGAYKIIRPDGSVTTISKNPSGDYDINNDKIGFMGTAHPDETGLQYELGSWSGWAGTKGDPAR